MRSNINKKDDGARNREKGENSLEFYIQQKHLSNKGENKDIFTHTKAKRIYQQPTLQ